MDAVEGNRIGWSAMTAWQYARLSITRDIRTGDIQTIWWHGPGQGLGENFTGSGQSVLELLNRVGADGWELAGQEERQELSERTGYWDPSQTVTTYTFKNPMPT